MRAMIFNRVGQPLELADLPIPKPYINQVLLKVSACGVYRTDLHIVDGELNKPKLPLILGHQIVGTVVEIGEQGNKYSIGTRVGVPRLGHIYNCCRYCLTGKEICATSLRHGFATRHIYGLRS